jgi:hypothetical protein
MWSYVEGGAVYFESTGAIRIQKKKKGQDLRLNIKIGFGLELKKGSICRKARCRNAWRARAGFGRYSWFGALGKYLSSAGYSPRSISKSKAVGVGQLGIA